MSPIAAKLKDYVDSLDGKDTFKLDITVGKVLYSTFNNANYSDTIVLPEIEIRVIFDAKSPYDAIAVSMDSHYAFSLRDDADDIIYCINKIFTLLENVTNRPISDLTAGVLDYYDTK